MKILVIDDDPIVSRAIQRTLKDHEVIVENDSPSGVARVMSADLEDVPFEVILCDFGMPSMNGLEVLAAVRAHREPPILVLMSGYDDIVQSALHADGVLIKPFKGTEICELVEKIRDSRSRAYTHRLRRILDVAVAR